MKYLLATALVPLALIELILRVLLLMVLIASVVGLIAIIIVLADRPRDFDLWLSPNTFDLIREVIK